MVVAAPATRFYATLSPLSPQGQEQPPPPLPPRPASPAYFTGSPEYHDLLAALDGVLAFSVPAELRAKGSKLETPEWYGVSTRGHLSSVLGFQISTAQHGVIAGKVQAIFRGSGYRYVREIRELIGPLLRPAPQSAAVGTAEQVDEFGRASGEGWRKSAKAKVWLAPAKVPGTGEVMVNGMPLGEWTREETQRESVIRGLAVANRIGKYNAWCKVTGGGVNGQVEAVRLAISRALIVHEFDLKKELRHAGLISHDWRTVERKKPGQPKARKKFTWVKR